MAVAWLPKVVVEGPPNPVIEVLNEATGEYEYRVRMKGNNFSPKVFSQEKYTIRVGYPEQGNWKQLDHLTGSAVKVNGEEIRILF
jgi:hypothetical protein